VQVDLAGSRLSLPIAGSGLPSASTPTAVRTQTPRTAPNARTDMRRPEFR
jgi:hypothetical protein